MDQQKTIAAVQASQPPHGFKSMAEWEAWRAAEDDRMWAELEAQITAHFERAILAIEQSAL